MTVVGLDLSLTGAGIAIIRERGAYEVCRYGYGLPSAAPLGYRGNRIQLITRSIIGDIDNELAQPELVAIEDMPYGATGAGTIDRAGLWWAVVIDLQNRGIPVVQVNVSTLKIYATGKGTKVGKDEVMLAIARRYPDAPIESNDEADAFALAAIAARALGQPIEESLPQTHLRAMDKVKLP